MTVKLFQAGLKPLYVGVKLWHGWNIYASVLPKDLRFFGYQPT